MRAALTLAAVALLVALVSAKSSASDSTELLFGVITPQCFDAFVTHHDFANVACIKFVISKLLGYLIITGAFILKLPQILKILSAKDVTGLTPASFYMEVLLYISTTVYNLLKGYPVSTWGENIVILVQNVVLVLLLWAFHVPKIPVSTRVALTIAFVAVFAGMMATPPEYQWLLASASIPVSIVARAPQVVSNFKQGHTGQLAFVTLVLNFGGTIARLFTTLQETGDPVQLAGLGVAMVLNGLLVLQVLIYWNATKKVLAAAAKKKAE